MIGDGIFDNDADIEQHQLEQAGNRIASLKRKGICLHGHINTTTHECYECKKTWTSEKEMFEEIDELALEYGI
jgi:hypothetical protein